MCILYSCTDDMSLNNYIQEELEDVEVVDISDDKDPYLLQIIKCEEFVGNKALSVNDVVKNAGSIYIDGSEFQTVIIGDLHWIVSDLNIMTELDPKYHTLLWSAPENHRGWKIALWLYDNCDNDEINGLVTIDVDEWGGPVKKSKVKGSVTTTHYLYKHAMIIDSLLQNDEDFIECDELIDEYEPIGKWHIPSVKNAELIQGLTFVDVANVITKPIAKINNMFQEFDGHTKGYVAQVVSRNIETKVEQSTTSSIIANVQDRAVTLHQLCKVKVYDLSGLLVYQGYTDRIVLNHQGVYIINVCNENYKICIY